MFGKSNFQLQNPGFPNPGMHQTYPLGTHQILMAEIWEFRRTVLWNLYLMGPVLNVFQIPGSQILGYILHILVVAKEK